MMFLLLVLFAVFSNSVHAGYTLRQLSYTKLPASVKNDFKLFSGTAQEGAFDHKQSILYVVGQSSHLLHVLDIHHPENPVLLFSKSFDRRDGTPRSVSFCAPQIGIGELAVALSAPVSDTLEGHVQFFHPHQRGSAATDLTRDGYMTVGSYPDHIKYTPDCGSVVVANQGKPGKDLLGKYLDPPGTVSVIHGEKTGNPSVQLVEFNAYNSRTDIRSPAKYIPLTTLSTQTTLVQDLEPECVAVSQDSKKAYVTLQENDAIATIDISSGLVTDLNPLPKKSWDEVPIDASDRDGGNGKPGVHRRMYNVSLQSIRQPSAIKVLRVGRQDYLFTADEGHTRTYTSALHTFAWTDDTTARSIASKMDPSMSQDFRSAVANDEYLGRLHVSKIDGLNLITDKYEHLEAFGGRGFSIWDVSDLGSPVYDSAGTLEQYMEMFDKSVFNTDCVGSSYATYQSPETLRDTSSDNMGPKINALDVVEDNGTIFLVVGSEPSGFLFVYTVDTSSGTPVPQFQSAHRSGLKDLPWDDLFIDGAAAGDAYIADIGIIPSAKSPTDHPLVYVISSATGSVSIYEFVQQQPIVSGKRK